MRKPEVKLPTLLGLLIAIGGLFSGLWLLKGQVNSGVFATPEEAPKEVKITNITDSGFVVSWITDKSVSGFVQYGPGTGTPDLVMSDERDQEKGAVGSYFTHYVVLKGLSAQTTYSFRIGSGRRMYDQQGKFYEVKTGPQLSNTPPADVAYGQAMNSGGDPAEGAIVYLQTPGMTPQSTLVKSSGSWVVPLSTGRNESLQEFASYDREKARVELFVQAGPMGTASVITTTQNDSPTPQIVLGNNYNYQQEAESSPSPTGAASSDTSKFSAQSLAPATETTTELVILSPKFGEKVNSARPEIMGQGPANTVVTIEVNSNHTITDTVTTDSNGRFTFSVPEDLEPGEHTVTLTAVVNGVTRRITRSFTVHAAGETNVPAFSATASATLAPSPTRTTSPTPTRTPTPTLRLSGTPVVVSPTATIRPTATVRPTATLTPTKTPTATPTPKPVGGDLAVDDGELEKSGSIEWTTILLLLGLGLIGTGAWWYKKA